MAKRRNFTPEFKAEVVLEALTGESSQAEVCIGLNKRWHFMGFRFFDEV